MNLKKAEIPFVVLAALIVIGVVVLVLLNKPVPTFLYLVLSAVLAGGLGIATPNTTSSELPPEISALAADLHGLFGSLLDPAATTPAPAPTASGLAAVPPPAPPATVHAGVTS